MSSCWRAGALRGSDSRRKLHCPNGPWVDITEPADAAYVRQQLISLNGHSHRRTSRRWPWPHLRASPPAKHPTGGLWPEDQPDTGRRLQRLGVASVVGSDPGRAEQIDVWAPWSAPGGKLPHPARGGDGQGTGRSALPLLHDRSGRRRRSRHHRPDPGVRHVGRAPRTGTADRYRLSVPKSMGIWAPVMYLLSSDAR